MDRVSTCHLKIFYGRGFTRTYENFQFFLMLYEFFCKFFKWRGETLIIITFSRATKYTTTSESKIKLRKWNLCFWSPRLVLLMTHVKWRMIHKLWRIDFQIEFWVICKTKKASLASIREEKAKSQKRSSTETFLYSAYRDQNDLEFLTIFWSSDLEMKFTVRQNLQRSRVKHLMNFLDHASYVWS